MAYLQAKLFRYVLLGMLSLPCLTPLAHADDALRKISYGTGDKSIGPTQTPLLVAEYMGYYKAEGLTVEIVPVGSQNAVVAGVDNKRLDFGTGPAAFVIPRIANGETLSSTYFYESTYPFRFGMGVKAGSPIKSYADLKGKRLGVGSFGVSDYAVGKTLLKLVGIDPEKDVSWLAVGEGNLGGIALQRGDIDALMTFDSVFGQIESAGIKLDYLPLPANAPMIGGAYLSASRDYLRDNRAVAVGFACGILKGEIFTQTNPEAAAYIFAQKVPEALPKGQSLRDQVKSVMVPLVKRMPLFAPYDKSVKWGFIKDSEWRDEIAFYGFTDKIKNPSVFYTNDLIDDVNNFDWDKVRADAKNFKVAYPQ